MNIYSRDYFVPVVVKNRDYLVGFLTALDAFSLGSSKIDMVLSESSAKFNDVLPGGLRRRNISLEDQIGIMIDYRMKMSAVEDFENLEELEAREDKFLEINCECGNYYSFDSDEQIPSSSLKCDICGKHLIDYTNRNDADFEYDGNLELHLDFTDVLEMFIDDSEDDEPDEEE